MSSRCSPCPCPCCCFCRLAHANLGFGLASAAGLLALADKASLATAFLSFSCGLSGELLVSHAQQTKTILTRNTGMSACWLAGWLAVSCASACIIMHHHVQIKKTMLTASCLCCSCLQALKHSDSQDGTKSE
jgi:hypothetical protein